jgi:hypothetical protein
MYQYSSFHTYVDCHVTKSKVQAGAVTPDLRDISYPKKPNIPTLSLIAENYIQGLNERINYRSWRTSDFIIKGRKIYR